MAFAFPRFAYSIERFINKKKIVVFHEINGLAINIFQSGTPIISSSFSRWICLTLQKTFFKEQFRFFVCVHFTVLHELLDLLSHRVADSFSSMGRIYGYVLNDKRIFSHFHPH